MMWLNHLESKGAVLIEGAKWCGKTTSTSDKKGIKTEKHVADIIEYLNTVGEAGASEIAEHICLGRDRTRVILKNMNNIESSGNNKNRVYRLKKTNLQ